LAWPACRARASAAAQADLVYIIPTSPGPKLELILFSRYKEVAAKLHVLLPACHTDDTFTGRVFEEAVSMLDRHHQVRRFTDFNTASVVAYCVDQAKSWYMAAHPEGPPCLSLTA
jgi:hypothetical protein